MYEELYEGLYNNKVLFSPATGGDAHGGLLRRGDGVPFYDPTFSRTVGRLYGGAKGLVVWYYQDTVAAGLGPLHRALARPAADGREGRAYSQLLLGLSHRRLRQYLVTLATGG